MKYDRMMEGFWWLAATLCCLNVFFKGFHTPEAEIELVQMLCCMILANISKDRADRA